MKSIELAGLPLSANQGGAAFRQSATRRFARYAWIYRDAVH